MREGHWSTNRFIALDCLPKLAWAAKVELDRRRLSAVHGTGVEKGDRWLFEGIWNGEFPDHGFDKAPEVYGSGFRIRGRTLTFVAPSTTTERIWYVVQDSLLFVSNSLPLLLSESAVTLSAHVENYSVLSAQTPGDPAADAVIPASPVPVHVLAHHSLELASTGLAMRIAKPKNEPFSSFEDYREFLWTTADRLAANANSGHRSIPLDLLTTISSGYDSPAAAVVARRMGCRKAVTLSGARSLFPRQDSGAKIAESLNLRCKAYSRAKRGSEDEIYFWAALGHPQDEHFANFDYPDGVTILFTGQFGGNIWAIDSHFRSPFERSDWSGLGFTEYRLKKGLIHCPVPFWGSDQFDSILRISRSPEMKPWVLGGEYDRPIPRRLVEDAGVPRHLFGVRKSATQYDDQFLWPRNRQLSEDLKTYLRRKGVSPPPVKLARAISTLNEKLIFPLENRLFGSRNPRNMWPSSQNLLFQWANEKIAAELSDCIPPKN